jgi:hypothetical protein
LADPYSDRSDRPKSNQSVTQLHAMALEYFFTSSTQLCAIPLQALLNGHIITHLFSAKAGSIARTRLLLLWGSEMATLCRCRT